MRHIKLSDEGLQNFGIITAFGAGREISIVAAAATPAKEKDLDAGFGFVRINRNGVAVFDAVQLASLALHLIQRADAIAIYGGGFIIGGIAGFLHFLRQAFLDFRAFVLHKSTGFVDQSFIRVFVDFVGTGRATTFDLMQQARTRAMVKNVVRARTQ